MADQKISDLSTATPADTDSIPAARSGGSNVRFLWSAIKAALQTVFDARYGSASAVTTAQNTADAAGTAAASAASAASSAASAAAGAQATADAKYTKPGTGIPASDLAAAVQTALSDPREWSAATVDQAEAEAGTATTRRAWTAQRVWQAIGAWWTSISTAAGRAIVTAADAAAQRTAMGAAASGAITSSGLTQATARLLGRTTAGTGAPEEISVGSGLNLSAGVLTGTGGLPSGMSYSANTLTLANGASPQVIALTRTTDGGANVGKTDFRQDATAGLVINSTWSGSVSAPDNAVDFQANGLSVMQIRRSSGNVQFLPGANFGFSARMLVSAPAVGVFRLTDHTEVDFGRIQLGGTSSSYPAIKRSGAQIQIRLADDSAFAPISASLVLTSPMTVATLPAAASWAGGEAYVTDASSPTIGSTVAGGASARAVVRSNGTNWIVTAIV